MRVESVTAHAFGPILGQTLKLAPQMTVIAGGNESAKSSWHAAIYAGLCGRRRGKGAARSDERRFAELHRPWDGGHWRVSAVVLLDDGRRIELDQDLDGRSGCSARDLLLGARDVSGEIMNDGAPDASKWLGLDRRSFVATACVRQAQLLGVLEGAETLQSHLERAAATAGADSTATEALERLKKFRHDHVGRDDARSNGPVRRATRGLDEARERLQMARDAHAGYLEACEEVERLREEAAAAEHRRDLLDVAVAAKRVEDLRDRCIRAAQLYEDSGGVAPASSAEVSLLSTQVAEALEAWKQCREPPASDGLPAAELETQIAMLPPMPDGPVSLGRDIEDSYERLCRCDQELAYHDANCSDPRPDSRPGTRGRLQPAGQQAQAPEIPTAAQGVKVAGRRAASVAVVGAFLVVSGLIAGIGVSGSRIPGALLAVAGAVLIAAGGVGRFIRSRRPLGSTRAELSKLEALHAADQEWRRLWQQRQAELLSARARAQLDLQQALVAAGAAVGEDVMIAFDEHRKACADRSSSVAEQARRRDVLEAQIVERRRFEKMCEEMAAARADALSRLLDAAEVCGVPAGSPEEALCALAAWKERCEIERDDLDRRRREWEELKMILDDKSIDVLADELASGEREVADRARELCLEPDDVYRLARSRAMVELAVSWRDSNETAREARGEADRAGGALESQRERLPAVADAEEAVELADEELKRLRDLDQELELTTELLVGAQAEVQRDIAPKVALTLKRWLPRVTAERYLDATVDPKTLKVSVYDRRSRWRSADQLSHGATEQVYLLLRVALSDCLVSKSESCPLLLDDVTVHADSRRTVEILEWLHELSAERQVVVFTQEEQVTSWAQRSLREPADALHELFTL